MGVGGATSIRQRSIHPPTPPIAMKDNLMHVLNDADRTGPGSFLAGVATPHRATRVISEDMREEKKKITIRSLPHLCIQQMRGHEAGWLMGMTN